MILRITETQGLLDCEYNCDLSYFTNQELHEIKVRTGLRAGEFSEALDAGDNDMMTAMAQVVLVRNGRQADVPTLWNLPAGKISLDFADEQQEVDALPPQTEPDDATQTGDAKPSSGISSNGDGDAHQVIPLAPTGLQVSATGAMSPPPSSAS